MSNGLPSPIKINHEENNYNKGMAKGVMLDLFYDCTERNKGYKDEKVVKLTFMFYLGLVIKHEDNSLEYK